MSGHGGKVKTQDRGWAKLVKELTATQQTYVTVGVHQSQIGRDDALNNAMLASIHEFGAWNNRPPQRSFLRSTLTNRAEDIATVRQHLLKEIVEGRKTAMEAAKILAQWVENAVDKTFADGIKPGLADSTKEARLRKHGAKGGNPTPLIDTGQLRASIRGVAVQGVRPKGAA